jgi:SAM-dependent methyltransferase
MKSPNPTQISVLQTARTWWKQCAEYEGSWRATRRLFDVLWEYVRDSTPDRLKARFGDADYDWDFRVNTTSGAVGWRDRLVGMFHSAYQPTEPAAFHEMMGALKAEALRAQPAFSFSDFTFVDLGSGKGRTLLMASDYPFRRIVGVELLPTLHMIALENLARYKSDSQRCFALESVCAEAAAFPLPDDPLVIFLFNPFPETGMRQVVRNLEQSLRSSPRAVYVVYHNALLEFVLAQSPMLKKIAGAEEYSIYRNRQSALGNQHSANPELND